MFRNPYNDLAPFMSRHALIASLKFFAREDPKEELAELVDLVELTIILGCGGRQ